MKCNEIKYYLNDYADGHLLDEIREEIKNHLDVCADCRSYYNDILTIISKSEILPREIMPSRDLWEGINKKISGGKKPARIFEINYLEDLYNYRGSSKFLSEKPGRNYRRLFIAGAATASVLLGIILGILYYTQSSQAAFWTVETISGTPVAGSVKLTDSGVLKTGEWLETDDKSSARLKVGLIGEVKVQPQSRIRLIETDPSEYRISMDRGKIDALIWAPPRIFFVETPSATAIDLGCMYTLEVAEDGSGLLKVTSGWVALQSGKTESLIPADAWCKTRKSFGPGTPFFNNASREFKSALDNFDFGGDRNTALGTILKEAGKDDVLSLWHILDKVSGKEKEQTYNRISELVDIPGEVTPEGIMKGDREMMNILWEALGYGSRSLWNFL